MKSFLSDRPRVATPGSPIEIASPFAPAASGAASVSGGKACASGAGGVRASSVECVREGDRITRLVVTCACGERIEIDCVYAAGA